MNRWTKVGIVLGGYALAFAASWVAGALYDRQFSAADNNAMGGMIAAGEAMNSGAVFLLFALVPTGLALWFLRESRRFWSAFSWLCVGFAVIGAAATLLTVAIRPTATGTAFDLIALLGIFQMLGSPLWAGGFGLFMFLAPAPHLQRRLLIATGLELFVGLCGITHFLGLSRNT